MKPFSHREKGWDERKRARSLHAINDATHVRPRLATLKDLPALLALEARFPSDRIGRRAFRHLLTRANAEVWVAGSRGRVAASLVILFRRGARYARLYSIVTDPALRSRGIGSALARLAERRACARGCDRIGLEARARDARVLRWYRGFDYSEHARLPGFYEDGAAAMRMQKILSRDARRARPRRKAT